MRRHLAFRVASALLAVWFVVVAVHPDWMHSMTMPNMRGAHSGYLAAQDGMAGMAGHDSSPTKQDDSNGCAEHDCCCSTAVVSVPRSAELAWVPAEIVREEAVPPVERVALSLGEHVIPFAIGPPEALTG
jgi:hypothetical protein